MKLVIWQEVERARPWLVVIKGGTNERDCKAEACV